MTRLGRTAPLAAGLALLLAGCGGGSGTGTAGGPASSSAAPSTAAPSTAASSTTAPSTASPGTAAPSSPAARRECPLKAEEVRPPAGATEDLSRKPVVRGSEDPAPTTVQVADIVEGKGQEAGTLDQVEVKYVGAFYDTGKEFDSSWSRGNDETLPFTVCAGGVIPGFSIAPTGMKVGGRRQVTIPPRFGYGAQGQPPTIPGGATLVFVLDLVKVTSAG